MLAPASPGMLRRALGSRRWSKMQTEASFATVGVAKKGPKFAALFATPSSTLPVLALTLLWSLNTSQTLDLR